VKRFLDSSILVESCLRESRPFAAADMWVKDPDALTSALALAECYATLSGDPRLRIKPAEASRIVQDLAERLPVKVTDLADNLEVIAQAPKKVVRGGMIYDALHTQTARRAGCGEVRTLNESHFKHVAPDLKVLGL
jgi:predicted nucleic acid-binding protein